MVTNPFIRERTVEDVRAEFNSALDELCLTNVEIAHEMIDLGDYRSLDTIMRSLQRMRSGEARVSGEMFCFVRMLLRRQRRLFSRFGNLPWIPNTQKGCIAQTDDYIITLFPQTKGRWLVNLQHKVTGFCPPWPTWQESLDAAKKRALICIERAEDLQAEHEIEQSRLTPQ